MCHIYNIYLEFPLYLWVQLMFKGQAQCFILWFTLYFTKSPCLLVENPGDETFSPWNIILNWRKALIMYKTWKIPLGTWRYRIWCVCRWESERWGSWGCNIRNIIWVLNMVHDKSLTTDTQKKKKSWFEVFAYFHV